jgi:hypothetical protein
MLLISLSNTFFPMPKVLLGKETVKFLAIFDHLSGRASLAPNLFTSPSIHQSLNPVQLGPGQSRLVQANPAIAPTYEPIFHFLM